MSTARWFDSPARSADISPMPVVTVSDLRKTYGATTAVDSISFSVEQGEIFGLLGPNGAGKTTTIECLEGLREFDSGIVSVLGLDPASQGSTLRRRIGMLLQESALPDDIKVWEALLDLSLRRHDTGSDLPAPAPTYHRVPPDDPCRPIASRSLVRRSLDRAYRQHSGYRGARRRRHSRVGPDFSVGVIAGLQT